MIYPYFGAFTRLRVLLLTGLDIGNISDTLLPPNAHVLHLTHGKMGSFPFLSKWVPNIKEFVLRSYQLLTIPQKGVAGLYQLKYFDVSHNKIDNFPNFSHYKQLKGINLEHNKSVNIPREHVEGLDSINTMKLNHNTLTNMTDISNLPTLETFKIGYNVISKIPNEFIEGLPNMRRFYCNNNKIYILPYMSRYFPRLEELSVEGNYLETLLGMYEMQPVFTLTAAENPYTCNVSLCWLRMLPWMKPTLNILRDRPLCEEASLVTDTEVLHFHPTDMECYKGKSTAIFQYWNVITMTS